MVLGTNPKVVAAVKSTIATISHTAWALLPIHFTRTSFLLAGFIFVDSFPERIALEQQQIRLLIRFLPRLRLWFLFPRKNKAT
jgi:hypothetical protein